MKKKLLTLLFFLVFGAIQARVFASFENLGIGARVPGMAGAFTGSADDINALYYNPAGLAYIENIQFEASACGYYLGLSAVPLDGFLAVARNFGEGGSFAFGYLDRWVSDLYRESNFSLSYAKLFYAKFSAGISVKYMHKQYKIEYDMQDYTVPDPVFLKGNSSSALSLDLGILYKPFNNLSIGIFGGDINRPDIGILENEFLPVLFKAGISANVGENKDYMLNADLGLRDEDIDFSFGFEKWFSLEGKEVGFGQPVSGQNFALRSGLSIGTSNLKNLSFGFGYRPQDMGVEIDYAFIYPFSGILSIYGTHRFAVKLCIQ